MFGQDERLASPVACRARPTRPGPRGRKFIPVWSWAVRPHRPVVCSCFAPGVGRRSSTLASGLRGLRRLRPRGRGSLSCLVVACGFGPPPPPSGLSCASLGPLQVSDHPVCHGFSSRARASPVASVSRARASPGAFVSRDRASRVAKPQRRSRANMPLNRAARAAPIPRPTPATLPSPNHCPACLRGSVRPSVSRLPKRSWGSAAFFFGRLLNFAYPCTFCAPSPTPAPVL